MFCRNCIDEGYGLCKLFFICKFFSNNNFMYFFFWNFCFYFGYTKNNYVDIWKFNFWYFYLSLIW